GTSMACPAVAGASALIRQYFVNGYYPSGSPDPADGVVPTGALIKATVINSSTDMTGVAGYPSNLEGWGRVRISDSLFFVGDNRALGVIADVRNTDGLNTGQVTTYNVNVTGTAEDLRITAVWTDVAATAGSAFASVNDLDLEVTSPAGVLFLGNVFAGGFSTSGGTKDDRNNVEQVHINNPASGAWTVRIRAAAVNSGSQGFSVIASGDIQLAQIG
ncbi:MAG: S8 family serine peptidase, partial [Planctomycetaceae bacterium]|nr:S8 family serine peptidase [Planctomycetaceae bacterium]